MRKPDRLARLGEAQAAMAKAIEMKLAAQEGAISLLLAARAEIAGLATTAAGMHMAFVPAALRRMADLDADLASARAEADSLRRRLIDARGREKGFGKRERQLREALARKAVEEQAVETSLSMGAKASGKPDVFK